MKIIDRFIYADEGKLLDFAKPHFAMNEDNVPVRIHLNTPILHMGIMDKPENYIEVDISEVE